MLLVHHFAVGGRGLTAPIPIACVLPILVFDLSVLEFLPGQTGRMGAMGQVQNHGGVTSVGRNYVPPVVPDVHESGSGDLLEELVVLWCSVSPPRAGSGGGVGLGSTLRTG